MWGQPQYEVQLLYSTISPSFRYSTGRENQLSDGSCCVSGEDPAPCPKACSETRIALCFREAQHQMDDTDLLNCPLGTDTFTPGQGTNSIMTFDYLPALTTTSTYPVSYSKLVYLKSPYLQGSYQLYYEQHYHVD